MSYFHPSPPWESVLWQSFIYIFFYSFSRTNDAFFRTAGPMFARKSARFTRFYYLIQRGEDILRNIPHQSLAIAHPIHPCAGHSDSSPLGANHLFYATEVLCKRERERGPYERETFKIIAFFFVCFSCCPAIQTNPRGRTSDTRDDWPSPGTARVRPALSHATVPPVGVDGLFIKSLMISVLSRASNQFLSYIRCLFFCCCCCCFVFVPASCWLGRYAIPLSRTSNTGTGSLSIYPPHHHHHHWGACARASVYGRSDIVGVLLGC